MLARLLLIVVQLVVGWYATLEVMKVVLRPNLLGLEIFVVALLFAVIVWAIGLLAAGVFKDLARPTTSTLLFSFATAVLISALSLLPDVASAVGSVTGSFDAKLYPLVGAVLGYAVQN